MCHDVSKKFFFNIFKKKRIIKEIVDYWFLQWKNCKQRSFILHLQQGVDKHNQNFSLP